MAYLSTIYKSVYLINELLKKNNQPYYLHISQNGGFGYGAYYNSVHVFSFDAKLMLLDYQFRYSDDDQCLMVFADIDYKYNLTLDNYDDFYGQMMTHIHNVQKGYDVLSKVFNVDLWYGFSIITPKYEKYRQMYVVKYNMSNSTFIKSNGDGYKNMDDVCKIVLEEMPELRVKSWCRRILKIISIL